MFEMYVPDQEGKLIRRPGLLKTLRRRALEKQKSGGRIYLNIRCINEYNPHARVGLNPVIWERYLGLDDQGNP